MRAGTAFILALGLLLFALVPWTSAAHPIRIGLQGLITGPWALEGEMAVNSVQIAVEEINPRGGLLGRPVELVIGDDMGLADGAEAVAQRFIAENVVAVIGSYGSTPTEHASRLYEEAGILNIAYGATAVRLTERGYRYFFRTASRDDKLGEYFGELVRSHLGKSRVAIVHDNSAFSRGLAEAARASLEGAPGVEIVFYDAIAPGENDYSADIERMSARTPDVVYFTAYYPEAGVFVRQMREAGLDTLFVGGNGAVNAEFIAIAGPAAAREALMTNEPLPADLSSPEAEAFLTEYVARHDEPPSSPWPVYAADALNVIAAAIAATGSTDSDILADYLRTILSIEGITGPIAFDVAGDRKGANFKTYVVDEDGQFVDAGY